MLTRIKIDDKQARETIFTISAGSKAMAQAFEANRPAIAAVASTHIRGVIADIDTIGPFLAPRTKIEVKHTGNTIILSVSGMNEQEAGFPPVSGGEPSGEMNLWAWHEYGPSNPEGGETTYTKDVGGVKVTRSSKNAGAGSIYRGAVREVIGSLTTQLNIALRGVSAHAANNIAATVVETATRGKVKVPRSARAAMSAAGITGAYLAALGATKVGVTTSGQIYVIGVDAMGGTGFLSSKSLGIPTTIRTR